MDEDHTKPDRSQQDPSDDDTLEAPPMPAGDQAGDAHEADLPAPPVPPVPGPPAGPGGGSSPGGGGPTMPGGGGPSVPGTPAGGPTLPGAAPGGPTTPSGPPAGGPVPAGGQATGGPSVPAGGQAAGPTMPGGPGSGGPSVPRGPRRVRGKTLVAAGVVVAVIGGSVAIAASLVRHGHGRAAGPGPTGSPNPGTTGSPSNGTASPAAGIVTPPVTSPATAVLPASVLFAKTVRGFTGRLTGHSCTGTAGSWTVVTSLSGTAPQGLGPFRFAATVTWTFGPDQTSAPAIMTKLAFPPKLLKVIIGIAKTIAGIGGKHVSLTRSGLIRLLNKKAPNVSLAGGTSAPVLAFDKGAYFLWRVLPARLPIHLGPVPGC